MQIEAVFRPLIDLERAIADLYGHWSDVYEADREAAFVWVKMANEEKGHASLVDYERRVVQKNPKMSGEVDISLAEVASATEAVRNCLQGQPLSLEDAVRFAYDLETAAAESHYRNAVKLSHPELQRLLDCLGSEDRQHIERLKAFAEKRGISLRAPGRG
jgi:rubrerythrin